MNDDETRIAKVFRLAHGSKLPDVSNKSLTIYRDYLSKHLKFPVKALYAQDVAPFQTTRGGHLQSLIYLILKILMIPNFTVCFVRELEVGGR